MLFSVYLLSIALRASLAHLALSRSTCDESMLALRGPSMLSEIQVVQVDIIIVHQLCNNQSSKFIITALHLLHCFYTDEIMKEVFLNKWCKV